MGFTRAELESYRDTLVPDLIGPGCTLLVVGINPGLWTAAVGAHFARRGNRFYPALYEAGIVDRRIDASNGMSDDDRELLVSRGVGITNLAPRATARADELTADELRAGRARLHETVARVSPRVVAVLGISAYRTAFGVPRARVGKQDNDIEGVQLWVVPNPSGLNAHESVATLARWYATAARAAGISLLGSEGG
ncbi:mismatch-specific DNA-glycosylase [Rhodococcus sp. HNM0569]|uniref:mismatch-specific DNA-glycosylase n=1 Tax=Rhodococcus sp. HNM0569 TaxID=2716340 RepID=UPI00146B8477|nr:mismatch-specific DNA-glycosylase [Rhodococcus sp. HNM0569]NLU83823.1 mismatch-specific DNA-glycosylase [Rhodococcus sp. HNM0569]